MLRRFLNAIGLRKKPRLPKGVPVQIDGSSQINVLNFEMQSHGFTHDQTALVDLKNVKVMNEGGIPIIYFCEMYDITVHEQISKGDGKPIPNGLKLEKLRIPKSVFPQRGGMYNLKNIKLHSNGTMQIIATAGTVFEPVILIND